MTAIKTVNLTKKYKDVTAVDSLTLEIFEGELFSLLGVNGAGKSTTVNMLACLCTPTDGNGWVGGKSILNEGTEIKSIIAISPQESAVAPMLTVYENLELICGAHGMSAQCTKKRLEQVVEKMSLSDVIDKRADRLSGGYKRRLSIAMALICEPKILFLDEPTLGLDVISRNELWELIKSLKGVMTVVLTTHYMEEAELLSDRVGIMRSGRLLACDTPEEIKRITGKNNLADAFISVVNGEVSI